NAVSSLTGADQFGFFLLDMTKKENWILKQGLSSFQSQPPYQQVSDHVSWLQLSFELTSVKSYFSNPIF
ncbi:hypothetical protein, partial [Vibrio cyclitrophicus]|uniref:hypothetical protein n=1 Tax=Vibrio cyclitrophicus TaxID=47951 RepID=UPI0004922681